MCQRPRYIRQIHAIAAHSGELRTTIARLKYHGGTGWALIFGRLVMGWLNANLQPWDVDLIVANPTYVGAAVQHTEEVLRSAKREDVRDVWPFRPELLRLARPLPTSAGTSIAAKEAKAEALYHALWLGDRAAVSDKRMIVYDDVCTTGLQLNVAARFLHEQGARSVDGLVLARALWR
jgi:predicted amidophosphoribosyltransferase